MLPLLGLLYAVALIDRTNLGIARIAGMEVDLRLDIGERYSIASMIYFIPYTLLQIPGNLVLRRLGARNFMTICVVGWGASQLGMAFVPTWGYLMCGGANVDSQAGFFPSLVFIITTWYQRYEVQQRLAIFYLSSIIITSFSSIFAYGLTFLRGKGGLAGWAWIFLIEGLITIVLGILAYLYVPDFPDKSKFLTEEERKMILGRVQQDRGDSLPDKATARKVWLHLRDPIVWAHSIMFMATGVPAYAVGFFVTIILSGMGYSTSEALLLTAPPGLVAGISCYCFARLADRTRKRAVWLATQNVITIVGLAIAAYAKPHPVRYFGLFLTNMGATGCVPGVLAYSANNITSHSKRAVQTGLIIGMGGVAGIVATTAFRQKDFPRYVTGMWVAIALQLTMLFLLAVVSYVYARRNRLRREGKVGPLEGQEDFFYTI
ncbi:hypothetical protein NLJ89_g6162 [Agrocybe chaxingu]|uniref:Major facilitator superfamily (MFS) profile domain-containing protein n=1 Tax=Agrocybe chaxingu TaxID=84603 RepID=A0A9W8MUB9_9AGAR|nr:hypothetical protein NLJ89_g6162 [Agrocybe chaxingu]